jgi:hypothetical protein
MLTRRNIIARVAAALAAPFTPTAARQAGITSDGPLPPLPERARRPTRLSPC